MVKGSKPVVGGSPRRCGGVTRARRAGWFVLFALAAIVAPALACSATDLSGAWAERKVLSDTATFPLVGRLDRTTTLVQRVAITQSGTTLHLTAAYCSAVFANGPALVTTIDPAFVCSLSAITAEALLSSNEFPARFTQSTTTELHGVRLEHPDTDALPTSASDPRVFDQDGDGMPGITVHAVALGAIVGDVYVIERLRTQLEGEVLSCDRIEGQVAGTVEQVILGASNALFLGSIVSRPDPIPSHSTFVFVRVDPAWTCAEIEARGGTLFGD